jgi:capsular exopolysaccharide synthesis family protein
MDLSDYFGVVRRRWLVIVACCLVGLCLGGLVYAQQPSQYKATSTVFVSLARGDANYSQSVVQSYVEIVGQPVVLAPVIDQLKLNRSLQSLKSAVSVQAPPGTVVVQISVVDPQAVRASQIANALANRLSQVAPQLTPGVNDSRTVNVSVSSPAVPPSAPVGPSSKRYLVGGLFAGLVLGVAIALLLHLIDRRLRNASGIRMVTDSPVIGVVPDEWGGGSLRVAAEGRLPNAFRRLRANIAAHHQDFPRTIAVLSPEHGAGKTTVALGLAIALAETGERVLLIDADLRSPGLLLKADESGSGLTDVVMKRAELTDAVTVSSAAQISVLRAGTPTASPGSLISSRGMSQLIGSARDSWNVVVLDAGTVLASSDALILAQHTDGVLMVVDAKKTTRPQLAKAADLLDDARVKVLGVVLNRSDTPEPFQFRTDHPTSHAAPSVKIRRPPITPATNSGRAAVERLAAAAEARRKA